MAAIDIDLRLVSQGYWVIAWSLRRPSSSGPVTTDWDLAPPSEAKYTWNGAPYSAGEETRCVRLAPKTAVAHSAATAITVPSSAVATGSPPRPRSSACRIPISALAASQPRPRPGSPPVPLMPPAAAGGCLPAARGAPQARLTPRSRRPAPPERPAEGPPGRTTVSPARKRQAAPPRRASAGTAAPSPPPPQRHRPRRSRMRGEGQAAQTPGAPRQAPTGQDDRPSR